MKLWSFLLRASEISSAHAGGLCALVLCCIVIAGLWPFGHPRNEVNWLANQNAVHFGERATILSVGSLSGSNSGSCSIEMWLRPQVSEASRTVIAFYGPRGNVGLSLHQSLTDLRLDSAADRGRRAQMYIGDIFHAGKVVFLTILFGLHGTAVYLDGSLLRQISGFPSLPNTCSGSFVVGDSPKENDTWQGELGGLAIYQHDFTTEQVMSNYQA